MTKAHWPSVYITTAARSEQGDLVTDTRDDFLRAAWLVLARLERTT